MYEVEELPETSHKRIGLQVDIINQLIDASSVSGTPIIGPILLSKINELKTLLKKIEKSEKTESSDVELAERELSTIVAQFPSKLIDEWGAKIIQNFEFILHPATGYVSWWNDTNQFVYVRTFDEMDGLRWIPYEERIIAPNQVVRLTARGGFIHIYVSSNGATYDCEKNRAYRFNGRNVEPKIG